MVTEVSEEKTVILNCIQKMVVAMMGKTIYGIVTFVRQEMKYSVLCVCVWYKCELYIVVLINIFFL